MFLVCFSLWILMAFVGLRVKAVNDARLRALIELQDYCSEFIENNRRLATEYLSNENVSIREAQAVCERFRALAQRWSGCFVYFRKCSACSQFVAIHKWSYDSFYPNWQQKMIRILFMEKRS